MVFKFILDLGFDSDSDLDSDTDGDSDSDPDFELDKACPNIMLCAMAACDCPVWIDRQPCKKRPYPVGIHSVAPCF
jgi:hypothetical protein